MWYVEVRDCTRRWHRIPGLWFGCRDEAEGYMVQRLADSAWPVPRMRVRERKAVAS